jgi:uncharacterized repeat protein (TIGR02543 family)
MGSITIKYNGSTTTPVNAGTYSITIDVAVGESYTALNSLSLGTYKIEKATPVVVGTTQDITNVQPKNPITTLTGITVNGVNGLLEGSWQGTAPADYNTTQNVTMTFTPNDTTNYNNVTTTVSVTTKPTYTVAFNANGGTGIPPIQAATPENVPFTLPNNPFVKNGYYFAGWHDGTTLYSPSAVYTMPARNITFAARWNVRSYNITYDLDGGTSGANPTSYNIETPTITLKNATRTGYTFEGWFDAAIEGRQVTEIAQGSTGDKNLYARWTAKTYMVAFNANGGGTPSTASKNVTYDSTYGELPTVTREDYKSKGWFTAASGGTEITAATTVKITSGQTLYAQWEKKPEITVTAKSDSKAYDGIALTNDGWTYTGELATGDSLVVTVNGTRTDAGTAPNEVTFVKVMQDTTDVTENYKINKVNGQLEISKRHVTLTSKSESKQYDGTPLVKPEVEITGGGFVEGEATASATGTITKVGNLANTIVITEGAGFKAANYEITKNEGTLTITQNTAAIVITADNGTWTYDGQPHSKDTFQATGLPDGYKAEAVITGGITDFGTKDNVVESYAIKFGEEDVTAQFANVSTENGILTITKRPLQITAASDSKTYDGISLTNTGYSTTSGSLAAGQTVASVTVTGSQLYPGSSVNAASEAVIKDAGGNNVTGNYAITYVNGTLTVTKAEIGITVTAKSDSKKYDGTELTNNGWDLTSGDLATGDELVVTVVGSITDVGTAENKITSHPRKVLSS